MSEEKLTDIANEIICYSDGSYNIAWTDIYEELSAADKETVADMVYEQIEICEECGWYWDIDHLEHHPISVKSLCWQCYQIAEDALEEEE